jgi:hypothetical protein
MNGISGRETGTLIETNEVLGSKQGAFAPTDAAVNPLPFHSSLIAVSGRATGMLFEINESLRSKRVALTPAVASWKPKSEFEGNSNSAKLT